jgi:membrane-bound lytic murein transglycosylase A
MRQLTLASAQQQSQWLMDSLQPYRVLDLEGRAQGLLTGYFEPILPARRLPAADHPVPLYRPPAGLAERTPWFSRREIDTLPQAMQALRGREIAWLSDPIDALLLHIQGSGRLELTEADGSSRQVRVAFAGTNGQPYRSVNQWLLEQGVQRIAPWPQATKAWAAQNPQRVPELLWSNPRYVFFREEPIGDPAEGPRGALGVPLSAGRSIAVDPSSIAHGTPVWLVSQGPAVQLARLVAAQDSGAAIVGALRVDYFTGTGAQAGELASRIRQPLQAWVLWPRQRSSGHGPPGQMRHRPPAAGRGPSPCALAGLRTPDRLGRVGRRIQSWLCAGPALHRPRCARACRAGQASIHPFLEFKPCSFPLLMPRPPPLPPVVAT